MVEKRVPPSFVTRTTEEIEAKFVEEANAPSLRQQDILKALSEDELIIRYRCMDKFAQLYKGRILLEMRRRLKGDRKKLGQWIELHNLDDDSQQSRTSYMNLAEFFHFKRPMDRIGLSVALEIAKPKNKEVAEEAYTYALGRNLSVLDIRKFMDKNRPIDVRPEAVRLTTQESLFISNDLGTLSNSQEIAEVTQTATIGGITSAENVTINLNSNTPTSTASFGDIMPTDIMKLSSEYQELRAQVVSEDEEESAEMIEVSDKLAEIKKSKTKEEKIEEVKSFIRLLSVGDMESAIIASAVASYFNKVRYGKPL